METKVTQDAPVGFVPVTLSIKLSSQKELDAICSLFNCAPVYDAVRKLGVSLPYQALMDHGAMSSLYVSDICDALSRDPIIAQRVQLNK